MMYEFSERLKQALQQPLPGIRAHERMMSYKRPSASDAVKIDPEHRKGSVLVHFYPNDHEIFVSLMLRNTYNGTHSGQVSFPGGKNELNETPAEAALREANEELGIEPSTIEILGQLSPVYIPPSRFLVTPVVGINLLRPDFKPDPYEVAQLIEAPLSLLMDDAIESEEDIHLQQYGITIKAPCYRINGHTIWGATAMMICELKEVLGR
jgi:8-oxo-dGTP pyrophosphatase MutT (NUDIX family)